MGIFDRFTGGKTSGQRRGLPPNATFRITQEGRSKLQSFAGDPKSRVLMAVEGEESYTLDEVSMRSRLPRGRIERLMPVLVKQGYVQIAGGGGYDDGGEGMEEG